MLNIPAGALISWLGCCLSVLEFRLCHYCRVVVSSAAKVCACSALVGAREAWILVYVGLDGRRRMALEPDLNQL